MLLLLLLQRRLEDRRHVAAAVATVGDAVDAENDAALAAAVERHGEVVVFFCRAVVADAGLAGDDHFA